MPDGGRDRTDRSESRCLTRKLVNWSAGLHRPAHAVDQWVKMPAWLQQFERQGRKLLIEDVGIPELERLTKENELVIVAAGKSEIVKLFERDASRSAFDKPQHALALTYVNGLRPAQEYSRVAFNLIPGVGAHFVFPALTTVRRPVATLPSGNMVFGPGDAVVLNDPITRQGSNSATKAARACLDAILAHGDQPYTREWMQQTFERFWVYGGQVVAWTNSLLRPPPHIANASRAAA